MNCFRIKKQVWQAGCASLLFLFSAACASGNLTPTPLPTPQIELLSSPTAAEILPAATLAPPGREEIETYIVVEGDTLSSIAASFRLEPETILWANYDQLLDNPDFLQIGMQLSILPVDGVYHQIGGTDTVDTIAAFFAADAQAIIDWPGNQIDPNNPVIFAGNWILVPGGQRGLRRRMMPNLPTFAMAVSPEEFGSGACPENVTRDVTGDGQYIWPVNSSEVVGESFSETHPGVDLAVNIGGPVLAADDGVVVFSGWSNFGYGNMIMLDHGNGDFSLYSGLGSVVATCGSEVTQGTVVGLGGVSGHPAAPFVHFEIRRGEKFLDPLDELS